MSIETVKTVNGYKITRYEGTKGFYYVNVRGETGKGWEAFYTFRSARKAEQFIKEALPPRK